MTRVQHCKWRSRSWAQNYHYYKRASLACVCLCIRSARSLNNVTKIKQVNRRDHEKNYTDEVRREHNNYEVRRNIQLRNGITPLSARADFTFLQKSQRFSRNFYSNNIMDTARPMSNDWIPAKVLLDRELPVMLNAPFASVKQGNYLNDNVMEQGTKISAVEKERTIIPSSVINFAELKTETTINRLSNHLSPMRINHRAQIDVVDMQTEESSVYKYLLIYEEQYSKFVILRALKSKEAKEVAAELVEIVTTIGAPRIIQSGNGRPYAEQVVREIRILLRDFCVVHGDATKNGDARRDFKSSLKLWMLKNPGKQWQDCLKILQVMENTTANPQSDKIPSQLFFGRNICEDLRRTIGGKGLTGNFSTEDASTNHQERSSVTKDENPIPLEVSITEACEITAEQCEKDSRNTDYRGNLVEIKANENTFNPASLKSESSATTDTATVNPVETTVVDDEKSNFRCKICQKQYMRLGHLRNHMKTHTRIGNFKCTICCKSFRLSSLYDKHMQRFHEEQNKNESSETCERLEEAKNDVMNREEDVERNATKIGQIEEKSAEIQVEQKNLTSTSLLESVQNSGKKTSKKSISLARKKLKNSSTKVNRNPPLECTYCKQIFNFPSVLQRHMRSHTNERPYVCQVCNKSFKQLGHLSQHALTHTDYRSFNCTICAIKFDSLDALKLHSQSHKDETFSRSKDTYRLFECDSCKKVFTTKSVLERHIFTHSHERQFGCKICGKRFKQAGHVKSHMLVHTGERKFECTVCSKRFSLSNSLKKHMYVHNGEKPYQCDVCGARFLEKRNLNGHLMTHTNERPFSCKICGKRYTLADTLRRHISAAHEDGRTYQCEICAKMFKQLAHLSVHKKVHNDERPFQCHLCEKNFKHKNVLKSHLAIHANVRPFECDVCKATFVRKTNLQTHITSAHMNERPYVCTICNKRFKQISHLNGHIVVHSNSMPYQCDFCDRRCNRLDNLKKHMRLHTKNKE